VKPRRLFLTTCILAAFLTACGGDSGGINPPPPAGPFSNATLTGQFAFSLSGRDSNGAYVAHIGSIVADGQGHITGGLEDFLSLGAGTVTTIPITGGTYQIQSNGRAVMTLQQSTVAPLVLSFCLKSNTQGSIIETDLAASAGGSIYQQTPSDFSAAAVTGNYVFDFFGVSFSAGNVAPISIIGQFAANGGSITGGTIDINDGNATAPSGPITLIPGSLALDSSGNGTTYGRGTLSFNNRDYVYYIVDAQHIKVLEEDELGGVSGDAVAQTGTIPTQNSAFTGNYTYLVGGGATLGSQGAVARVARFSADGNGSVSAVSLDDSNDGSHTHISQGSNISSATYSIDTANAGSGRGTFTFTDSSAGTYTNVFYLSSPTTGVIQDTSKGLIADGTILAQQVGPFTVGALAGSYIFNWSGVQIGSSNAISFYEEFVGQYTLSSVSSSNIVGAVDYTELGLSASPTPFLNLGYSGTLTINGNGTDNNGYKVVVNGSPATTFNFQAYIVDPTTMFVVGSDSIRTTGGTVSIQTQ
jgi:hypothetical protein